MNAARRNQRTRNCIELLHIMKEQQFNVTQHVQASNHSVEAERIGEADKPTSINKEQINSRPTIELMLGSVTPQTT